MFNRKNCDKQEKYVPCVHSIHQRGLQRQVWPFLLTNTPKSAQQRHRHRNQLGTDQTIHVSLLHQTLWEILLSFLSKKRQKLSEANCVSLRGVTPKVLGWWDSPVCQRRAGSVSVGQRESQCGGENWRRLPKLTGIYPKGYRRMQASELLDLKDPQSKKQKYGVRKVQCLNRCNLLIKRSACRLPTKARSDF